MGNRISALLHTHSIAPDKANRHPSDFYRTPPIGTERLLDYEQLRGTVWEPACGDGAISEVLKARGIKVISTDLYNRGYGRSGVDFLTAKPPKDFAHILTNPPFKLIEPFVARALEVTPRKVIILARLLWLEGKTRRKFFLKAPLKRIWVSSSRLNVSRGGKDYGDGGEGGMVAFAWYVFERGYKGKPELGWLP